jgi:uncharacterized small protein (DUF1192 family)
MTREDAQIRKEELERRRNALVDQLTELDAQSASISAGGGSRSYTNRSVADIKAKIAFIDKEIARLDYMLGNAANPNAPTTVEVRFNG